ncbi:hypothetical protein Thpro_023095 [Acidihalobacter prosperus]|uniref:Uncharacterized protein n=1 Tax=Acidihalobacter prosperus TaxID=160660 RepID=A0A1A6C2S2_9GAMM|nr:hypothetical protein Thpro_023095 [Acidihalobacter prosperus]
MAVIPFAEIDHLETNACRGTGLAGRGRPSVQCCRHVFLPLIAAAYHGAEDPWPNSGTPDFITKIRANHLIRQPRQAPRLINILDATRAAAPEATLAHVTRLRIESRTAPVINMRDGYIAVPCPPLTPRGAASARRLS